MARRPNTQPASDPAAPSAGDAASDGSDASLSYEEAVESLEALIDRIESGEIGLEASIAAYERGASLVKRCREILGRAEQRIEQLSGQGGAEVIGKSTAGSDGDDADGS
ncbi:MAG: exodeoxyribonuclease VII small subunit [Planctomycetota bacterium]